MRITILTYHSIDDSGSVISTPPEQFRRQMRHLRDCSIPVLALEEVVAVLGGHRDPPTEAVAITFDDGYHSVYSNAFPILQEYGLPATVFLVSAYCGQASHWNIRTPRIGPALLASWEHVGEMARHGIDFGSHTVTHADLTQLKPHAIESELLHSKRKIEDRLSRSIMAFAYPFGRSNAEVRAMVERQYKCACSTRLGFVGQDSAPYRLKRIEMHYFSSDTRFESLLRGEEEFYLSVRRTLRLLRGLK